MNQSQPWVALEAYRKDLAAEVLAPVLEAGVLDTGFFETARSIKSSLTCEGLV